MIHVNNQHNQPHPCFRLKLDVNAYLFVQKTTIILDK